MRRAGALQSMRPPCGHFAPEVTPLRQILRGELKLTDARYLRAHGVVIVSEDVLQARSAPIGEYMGHPIWAASGSWTWSTASTTCSSARARERLAPRELFLEPGLVYVPD